MVPFLVVKALDGPQDLAEQVGLVIPRFLPESRGHTPVHVQVFPTRAGSTSCTGGVQPVGRHAQEVGLTQAGLTDQDAKAHGVDQWKGSP